MTPGDLVSFTSLMYGQYAVGDVVVIHGRRYRIVRRDGTPTLQRTAIQFLIDAWRRFRYPLADLPPTVRLPPGERLLTVASRPRARRTG
jgi:hypothetical protein